MCTQSDENWLYDLSKRHPHGSLTLCILFVLIVVTLFFTTGPFSFLKEEISLDPQTLELDVIPGKDLRYDLVIKNIGRGPIDLNESINGIDSGWLDFKLRNNTYKDNISPMLPGETRFLSIIIQKQNLSTAPFGKYKSDIVLSNRNSGIVLETIPLVLNVKEAGQTPKDKNHLTTCNGTPPTIIQEPEDQIISKDKKCAIFAVEAEGTQPLHYQWRKNIIENISGEVRNYYTYIYPGTVIKNKGPAGNYSVLVWNEIDNKICLTESRPATLRIV